jgi:hypothetical protein
MRNTLNVHTYPYLPIRRDWFDSEDIGRIIPGPVVNNRVRIPLAELLWVGYLESHTFLRKYP